jgi:hypothetical protein
MVSGLALSAVDRGFEPRSDQNKEYASFILLDEIGKVQICPSTLTQVGKMCHFIPKSLELKTEPHNIYSE